MEVELPKTHITQEEIMDTKSPSDSVQKEVINITEPDPELLKSHLDDVFGSVSTDAEGGVESISSIEEYQNASSKAEASKAWAEANVEAELKAGIKPCCSRCGTDSHTEVQCIASSGMNANKRKVPKVRTASQVRSLSGRRETFGRIYIRLWLRGKHG